jgi:hypothetical protein
MLWLFHGALTLGVLGRWPWIDSLFTQQFPHDYGCVVGINSEFIPQSQTLSFPNLGTWARKGRITPPTHVSQSHKNSAVPWEEVCCRNCWRISDFLLWALIIQRWWGWSLRGCFCNFTPDSIGSDSNIWATSDSELNERIKSAALRFGRNGDGCRLRRCWESPGQAEWVSLGHVAGEGNLEIFHSQPLSPAALNA